MAKYKGRTEDAGSLILSSKVWKKGLRIEGTVKRKWSSRNGDLFEIHLNKPFSYDGKKHEKVSVGNHAGLEMALQAMGLEGFEIDDKVSIECTGFTPTDRGNDMINFNVEVDR